MPGAIRNVAIAGAAGNLGAALLDKLVAVPYFKIRVLRRNGSASTFAPGLDVADVDFDSVDSVTAALAGQDAVVAAMGPAGVTQQKNIIDAAIAAGVQRFLPSEFGPNSTNPNVRKLPVFAEKVKVADYLAEKAKTTPLTYTVINNGPFLDWGMRHNFIINASEHKVTVFDGGDTLFSTTTLATIADAVVAILSRPEETKNRTVYIEDLKLSQNKLRELARQAAPEQPWPVEPASLDAVTQKADERLAKGLFDMETFIPYVLRSIFDPAYGCNFEETDNELLGLEGKTAQEVVDIIKQILQK